MKRRVIYFFVLFFCLTSVYAVKAYPGLITSVQPDGSVVGYYLHGDEHFSYIVGEDGYLLSYDSAGFLVYGELDVRGGKVVPASGGKRVEVSSLQSELDSLFDVCVARGMSRVRRASSNVGYPLKGTPKSLVILVNYSDCSFRSQTALSDFTDLLNENGYLENGATGSARDYFRRASNGVFDPEFVVVGPYDLGRDMKYYGELNGDEKDKRPGNLIVDACKAADEDVDFGEFDENGDGYIDNVFVYYAGYNQAEGGGANTIWPHRSYVVSEYVFDWVRLGDYACTSEFKGNKGKDMCGIGTFVHEFGHVLGLPDLYSTNYAGHATLGSWDVMDGGSYNSQGRTPPTYSAYERFYLGWMQPKQLDADGMFELDPLSVSNMAYLVAASAHNMDGKGPSPSEFFMLENRQKEKDDGVPAEGLLITRIVYDRYKWGENVVNNSAKSMGVEICCAERTTGAPLYNTFPGKSKVTSYEFRLRDGQLLGKHLSGIEEEDGVVSFVYGDLQGGVPTIEVLGELEGFYATLGESDVKVCRIKGSGVADSVVLSLSSGGSYSIRKHGFEGGDFSNYLLLDVGADSCVDVEVEVKYTPTRYSYSSFVSESFVLSTKNYYRPVTLLGCAPRPVYVVAPVACAAEEVSPYSFVAVWDTVYDATEYLLSVYCFDGVDTSYVMEEEVVVAEEVGQMRYTVGGLLPDCEYRYFVQASDRDAYGRYSNVTGCSNEIIVTTLAGVGADSRELDVKKQGDCYVAYVPEVDANHSIFIYGMDGRLVTSVPVVGNVVELPVLSRNRFYVLKYASNDGLKRKSKVVKVFYW